MFWKKLLLLGLFSALLTAASPFGFSKKELFDIHVKYSNISLNRINEFNQKLEQFKTFSKSKQLLHVNNYLNTFLPQYDAVIDKQEEHYKTPKEFLSIGYGDCEDYVIIKYFTLVELGFNAKKLFFAPVLERYSGYHHMVLLYYADVSTPPLVLDNLSFRILHVNERIDLKPFECYNTTGYYKIDSNGKKVKIKKRNKLFESLLKRIKLGQ
ncbi:MAG: transglutaminase-like cysteine peptidase [Campylobacterota bacterium]|nr:transglutaminase-like cysteine peptidase [Campylobacterota bacterium]